MSNFVSNRNKRPSKSAAALSVTREGQAEDAVEAEVIERVVRPGRSRHCALLAERRHDDGLATRMKIQQEDGKIRKDIAVSMMSLVPAHAVPLDSEPTITS